MIREEADWLHKYLICSEAPTIVQIAQVMFYIKGSR